MELDLILQSIENKKDNGIRIWINLRIIPDYIEKLGETAFCLWMKMLSGINGYEFNISKEELFNDHLEQVKVLWQYGLIDLDKNNNFIVYEYPFNQMEYINSFLEIRRVWGE